jgi:predicted nucleic acid-binding protein
MAEQVIDASIVMKWVVQGEANRPQALRLLRDSRQRGIDLIGPPLLQYEVESSLQRRLVSGRMTLVAADGALRVFYSAGVQIMSQPGMVDRARQIARQHRQERIYDSLYCALADLRKCEFWTADRTFYEAVRGKLAYVRYLPNYV